jgi:hypothetical protein
MDAPVKITKLGEEKKVAVVTPSIVAGKRSKTMRTFPKGILKIKGVQNPTKSAPLKRGTRKQTISLTTQKGDRNRKHTIRKRISKMSDQKVKDVLIKNGMSGGLPAQYNRETLIGGIEAGLIPY